MANADPVHIVLVHPSAASALVPETLTRIRGELVADGFEVSLEETPDDVDPSKMDFESRATTVAAIVGVTIDPGAGSARVWIVDRLTRKTLVRKVEMERRSEATPEILARRTVELLRASLLELLLPSQQPESALAPSNQATQWVTKAVEHERRSVWGVEAGVSMLVGTEGLDPAWLPTVRLRWSPVPTWTARLTLAGLGTRPEVLGPNGSATVSQEMGLAEVLASPWTGSVRSFFCAGVGAYHVSADGQADWPYEGKSASRWAFAAMAGVGVSLRIASQLDVSLEGEGLVLTPYPVVRFFENEAARTGHPSLLASLSVVGHL